MNKNTVLCILILIMAYASCSQKYDSENDFQVTPLIDGVSAEIANYSGKKSVVNIPPVILEMPVIRIGDDSFKGKEIDSVIIPEGVTSVGSRAFAYSSLASITISASVTSVGEDAFYGWDYPQTINIMGFESQAEADSAWQASWRNGCNARINFFGRQ
jgi:hypothetical protein